MPNKTWRAKRSLSIDLDFNSSFPIVAGQTYTDDGTSIFCEYICDDLFEPASAEPGSIVVGHPDARKSRRN